MATIIVQRAQAFRRGHCSIQILLDDKVVGTLFGDEPVTIATTEGPHRLRARMLGMKGAIYKLELQEDEIVKLQVSGVIVPKNYWWETLLFLLIVLLPNAIVDGPYFWAFMGAYLAALIGIGYSTRREMKGLLQLDQVKSEQRLKYTLKAA